MPDTILDNATISLAILTGLLFIATTAAVVVGAVAARSAANTFRLESEPVITLHEIDTADEDRVLGRKASADRGGAGFLDTKSAPAM
jgi:hypothetical protein